MINHLRTLLINEENLSEGDFEEFISPEFRKISLTSGEMALQRHLVPAFFPRRTRNYLATILSFLASKHKSYDKILEIDPRVVLVEPVDETKLHPVITVSGIGEFSLVEFSGELHPRHDTGIFSGDWGISKLDGTNIEIIDRNEGQRDIVTLSFTGDVSGYKKIGDSGISIRVVGATSVPDFWIDLKASYPISLDIHRCINHMRADEMTYSVFGLKDRNLGNELLQDFRFSDKPSIAVGAALIAYTIHVTERSYE